MLHQAFIDKVFKFIGNPVTASKLILYIRSCLSNTIQPTLN